MAQSKKHPSGPRSSNTGDTKSINNSSKEMHPMASESALREPIGDWNFTILKLSAEEAKNKHKATTEEFGIDVSRWQADRLEWGQLKEDGVQFSFHRVGSGRTTKDANYDRNVDGCLKNDIPFGNYFFLYEDIDMKKQARMFVQQADWRSTLPPVLDVERNGLTAEQIKTFVDEFHHLVDSAPIMIYTSLWKWNPIVPKHHTWPSRHPLWVAHYDTDTPALPHHWDRWTFFQPGVIKGLRGYPPSYPGQSTALDYNHFNGSTLELRNLEVSVRVRSVTYSDYLPFDSPVGNADQRRRKEAMYPGGWIDANPYRNYYLNPSTGNHSYHTGSDLNKAHDADRDEPVHAVADGVVTFAGNLNVWGNVIVIKHGPALYSRYGHVSNMRVQSGEEVKRGKLIAQVGQDAFGGPFHLHFDISESTILGVRPGHWPGNNLEALVKHYVDPKEYIERHRPQKTDPPPSPRLKVPTKFGYTTATNGLRFRSEPSTAGGADTILDILPLGTKVGIYSEENNWYHIRVGNQEGFVYAGYVSIPEPEIPTTPVTPPEPVTPERPETGAVIGIHGAPGHGAPQPHNYDRWTNYLKEMGIRWFKQCETSDGTGVGSIFQWVIHLKKNGIEPIIRYQMSQQFPNHLEEKHFQQMQRYAQEGVHWAEIGNEPNLGYEWQESWHKGDQPRMRWSNPESIETLARLWIEDAERAADMGVWPAFYAFGPTDWGQWRPNHVFSSTIFTDRVVKYLADHYRARTVKLFKERKTWIAVHVAKYEKALDYDPYGENPDKPWDMALRGYEVVLKAFRDHFGNDLDIDKIPIISTEGGVFVPDHSNHGVQAYRLPANDVEHAQQTVEMFRYVEKETPLTAMCPWCISEGDLIGWRTDMFRHHGWFKQENGNLHERPVYSAMRQLRLEREQPPAPVDEAAFVKGLDLLPAEGAEMPAEVTKPPAEPKTTVSIKLEIKLEISGKADDIEVNVDPGVIIE
jgi:murein DD-endopeptidase MepM/ murein hydrolase activator NlpD